MDPLESFEAEVREVAALLNDAMRRLSNVLSEIAASPEALTPEQLAAFAELATRTNELVASLDRTLNGLGPAIRDAGAPTREVLTSLLETTKAQAIDPTLAAIDRRVRAWLMLLILGALLVVGTAAAGLYLSTRQLSAAATILRSLGNDYQIVPRPTAAGRAPAGEPADADSETAPPDG